MRDHPELLKRDEPMPEGDDDSDEFDNTVDVGRPRKRGRLTGHFWELYSVFIKTKCDSWGSDYRGAGWAAYALTFYLCSIR